MNGQGKSQAGTEKGQQPLCAPQSQSSLHRSWREEGLQVLLTGWSWGKHPAVWILQTASRRRGSDTPQRDRTQEGRQMGEVH